jgi:hypothetical protein
MTSEMTTDPINPFFPGEEEALVSSVSDAITRYPLTVGKILAIIEMAGMIESQGGDVVTRLGKQCAEQGWHLDRVHRAVNLVTADHSVEMIDDRETCP